MAPAVTERQLTVEQAAERADCHPETIRRSIRRGELKASRNRLKSGSPYLLNLGEVKAFIARRTA